MNHVNLAKAPIILVQLMSSFVISFILYIFLALTSNEGGIDGFLGMIFIQPIYGFIVSSLLTITCTIIGLPIRFIPQLRNFCIKYYFIFISLFVLGLVFYVLSFTNHFSSVIEINQYGYTKFVFQPNFKLLVIGWFLVCFSALHFYYPSLSKNKSINS